MTHCLETDISFILTVCTVHFCDMDPSVFGSIVPHSSETAVQDMFALTQILEVEGKATLIKKNIYISTFNLLYPQKFKMRLYPKRSRS